MLEWRRGAVRRMFPCRDPDGAWACTGAAPWTPSLRRSTSAPKLCVPCLSPRPAHRQASTVALHCTQQLLLHGRREESAPCRTAVVTTTLPLRLVHILRGHNTTTRFYDTNYDSCMHKWILTWSKEEQSSHVWCLRHCVIPKKEPASVKKNLSLHKE